MKNRGNLFVITAPSGSGKGSIISKILERDDKILLSISATTRKARDGEIDGTHYHFLTKGDFEQKIADDKLLEYAKYADNYYGTPSEYVEEKLDEGFDVIVEIEVVGAGNVKKKFPDATLIFIMAPSFEELKNRLINRGTETLEVIEQRLKIAKGEIEQRDKFDFLVINDQLDRACEEILDIIKTKR